MSDVQNEIRAVTKLCTPGSHRHIIEVLRHGRLPNSPYYFFDMELCNFNLKGHADEIWNSCDPFFIDWYSRLQHFWAIMAEIANGVSFIHEKKEVHRDLKPSNSSFPTSSKSKPIVLYSSRSNVWKIADFGISAEGTSRKALTTISARGTASYRAPELIKGEKLTYTSQVDIWAMGCIFFELAFNRKAFSGDMSVFDYALSGKAPEIPAAVNLGQHTLQTESTPNQALKTLIYAMLDLNPSDRPAAQLLYDVFSIDCDRAVQAVASAKTLDEARKQSLALVIPESVQKVSKSLTP